MKCHVTASGLDECYLGEKYKITDGVGCEPCHGAGGDYYDMKTMKAIAAGELNPDSVGLIRPEESVCAVYHNEAGSELPFDYKVKAEIIAHPNPRK